MSKSNNAVALRKKKKAAAAGEWAGIAEVHGKGIFFREGGMGRSDRTSSHYVTHIFF